MSSGWRERQRPRTLILDTWFFIYDPKLGMATLLNTRSAKQSLLPFRAPPEQFGSRSLHLDDLSRYERKRCSSTLLAQRKYSETFARAIERR